MGCNFFINKSDFILRKNRKDGTDNCQMYHETYLLSTQLKKKYDQTRFIEQTVNNEVIHLK